MKRKFRETAFHSYRCFLIIQINILLSAKFEILYFYLLTFQYLRQNFYYRFNVLKYELKDITAITVKHLSIHVDTFYITSRYPLGALPQNV